MIPKDTVDRIIETARIEEVVGDFVALKRRGVNMLGNCPFHNERTPSFTVSPAKGIYKCFGCGKAGNSVNFIMEHESSTYPEALRYLAKKYNIEIEEKELTAEDIEHQNEKESLFVVNTYAQKYFTEQLWETEDGKAIGLSYFRERGFRDDIIEKFQLGYSHNEWSAFTDSAVKAGYKLDYLEKTGLSIVKDDGAKKFDRFKGRVMFPIHSLTGRVLGFGGRVLNSADKTQAKYVNSPESEIYNKSRVLYGAFFAKKAITQFDVCYLVEGYTDVISMHQAGVENVVASSGTSLTHDQIKLISRYTKNITILYDGDPAGIKASFRGIDMILEEGMNVRVVLFPDGDDPDSYAKKVSIDELKDYIGKQAKDFVSFKTSLLIDEVGNDPIKRSALVKDIAQTISIVPDGIQRQFYIKECSRITGIDEETLLREVNKLRNDKTRKEREADQLKEAFVEYESEGYEGQSEAKTQEFLNIDFSDPEWQERDIIRLLLRHSDRELYFTHKTEDGRHEEVHTVLAGDFIIFELSRDEVLMQNPVYQAIYTGYLALQSKPEEYYHEPEFDEEDLPLPVITPENLVDDNGFVEPEPKPDIPHPTTHPDEKVRTIATDLVMDSSALSDRWYSKHRVEVAIEDTSHVVLKESIEKALHSLKMKFILKMIREVNEELIIAEKEEDQIGLMASLEKQLALISIKTELSGILGRVILH
jgi:DNA primase